MAEKNETTARASELKMKEKGMETGEYTVTDVPQEKSVEFNVVNRPPEGPGLGQKAGKVIKCDPEGKEVKDHEKEEIGE